MKFEDFVKNKELNEGPAYDRHMAQAPQRGPGMAKFDSSQLNLLHQLASDTGPLARANMEINKVRSFLNNVKDESGNTWATANPGVLNNLEKMTGYIGKLDVELRNAARKSPNYQNNTNPWDAMKSAMEPGAPTPPKAPPAAFDHPSTMDSPTWNVPPTVDMPAMPGIGGDQSSGDLRQKGLFGDMPVSSKINRPKGNRTATKKRNPAPGQRPLF